jgi:hypothetical protein
MPLQYAAGLSFIDEFRHSKNVLLYYGRGLLHQDFGIRDMRFETYETYEISHVAAGK